MQNMRRAPREFLRQTALCETFLPRSGIAELRNRREILSSFGCEGGKLFGKLKIPPPALSSQGKIKKPEHFVRAILFS